jgi:hypothetical protein
LAVTVLDKNFMQIGGFTLARERTACGSPQIPSPHINPEATAGTKSFASALFVDSQKKRMALPRNYDVNGKIPSEVERNCHCHGDRDEPPAAFLLTRSLIKLMVMVKEVAKASYVAQCKTVLWKQGQAIHSQD